jgi:hypothetical protein
MEWTDIEEGADYLDDKDGSCENVQVNASCKHICRGGFEASRPFKCIYDNSLLPPRTRPSGGACECSSDRFILKQGSMEARCLKPADSTLMDLINPPDMIHPPVTKTIRTVEDCGQDEDCHHPVQKSITRISSSMPPSLWTGTCTVAVAGDLPEDICSLGSGLTVYGQQHVIIRSSSDGHTDCPVGGPIYDPNKCMQARDLTVKDGGTLELHGLPGVVESFKRVEKSARVILTNVTIHFEVLRLAMNTSRVFIFSEVTVVDSYLPPAVGQQSPCAHIETDASHQWMVLSKADSSRTRKTCATLWNSLAVAGGNNIWLHLTDPEHAAFEDDISVTGVRSERSQLRITGSLSRSTAMRDVELVAVPSNVTLQVSTSEQSALLPSVSFENVRWICNATSGAMAEFRSVLVAAGVRPNITITQPGPGKQRCSRELLSKTFGRSDDDDDDDDDDAYSVYYEEDNTTETTVVTMYTVNGTVVARDLAAVSEQCFDFWGGHAYCSEWCNSSKYWGVNSCGVNSDPGSELDYQCDCGGCNGCP